MTPVTDFRIVVHGVDHPDYFQGHGISLTNWGDCATGTGHTLATALEDALEALAQNGWDVSPIESHLTYREVSTSRAFDLTESDEYSEMRVFVSVNVK